MEYSDTAQYESARTMSSIRIHYGYASRTWASMNPDSDAYKVMLAILKKCDEDLAALTIKVDNGEV